MKMNRLSKILWLVMLIASPALNAIMSIQPVWAASPRIPANGCTNTVKIMPLGDSITQGKYSGENPDPNVSNDDIGYRRDLWNSLISAGYNIDFIGSQINGEVYSGFDPDHEGHSGWTDKQIADNIYNTPGGANWLSQNPADVILLHIGTNTPRDPNQVLNILNEIDEYEANAGKSVMVVLARIINRVGGDTGTTLYNSQVASMAESRADYGTELFLVNMESGAGLVYDYQPTGDFFDYLHPYATGYTKMAAVWKQALDNLLQVCNNPPEISTTLGPQSNSEGDPISIDIDATDPDLGQTLTYQATNLPTGLSINSSTGLISGTIGESAAKGSPYTTQVVVYDDGVPSLNDTLQFSWTVTAINNPPSFTNPPSDQIDSEGDSIAIDINATDPDPLDTLTFTASNLPVGLSMNPSTGMISGEISYDAAADSPYAVHLEVRDNGTPVLKAQHDFTWTVADKNGKPNIFPEPGNQENDEGDSVNLPISASDPNGTDTLTYSATGLPESLSINTTTGLISGTISCNAAAKSPYAVYLEVKDDGQPPLSDSATFAWSVTAKNCPPQITDPGNQIGYDGEEVTLSLIASDPDAGDSITFSASGLPPGLEIDPGTGVISGVIMRGAHKSSPYTVEVSVTDSVNHVSLSFTWTVERFKREGYLVFLPIVKS
jgi:lysophospholipase L1-like esterase